MLSRTLQKFSSIFLAENTEFPVSSWMQCGLWLLGWPWLCKIQKHEALGHDDAWITDTVTFLGPKEKVIILQSAFPSDYDVMATPFYYKKYFYRKQNLQLQYTLLWKTFQISYGPLMVQVLIKRFTELEIFKCFL